MRPPNFARLNHVLIPSTKEGRDRIRSGWAGKLGWPLVATYGALTDEGRMLSLLMVIVGALGIDTHNSELYVLWAMLAAVLCTSILVRPRLTRWPRRARSERAGSSARLCGPSYRSTHRR